MSRLEEMKARHARELAEAQRKENIIGQLPDALEFTPTISNIGDGQIAAWLSFSSPAYDPDKTWNPVGVLRALEDAGWKLLPATLCKWDNYRRSPALGYLDDIPEEKRGSFGRMDKLSDASPIAPLWVIPEQHTGSECRCYMQAPGGQVFFVHVDLPAGIASVHARRIEYRGGWRFDRGSARLQFPDKWHGQEHCTVHVHSGAWVDTEQGISGAIYFEPHDEQRSWTLKASEFLSSLI